MLTMTDGCGMLSSIHKGDRRDLCASILFMIPIFREVSWIVNIMVMAELFLFLIRQVYSFETSSMYVS